MLTWLCQSCSRIKISSKLLNKHFWFAPSLWGAVPTICPAVKRGEILDEAMGMIFIRPDTFHRVNADFLPSH